MNESAVYRPVAGVVWMLGSGLCFIAVNTSVRWLGTDLPAAQSAFVRFAWSFVFLLPMLAGILRRGLPEGAVPLVLGRGLIHTAAVTLWFYAMARLPMAEVTAIGYLTPVLMTVGGALFFAEKLAARRLVATVVGVLGVLIVIRPGAREVELGHLSQVAAAIFFTGSYLMAKRLSLMMPAAQVVALMSATVTIGLLPLAVVVWEPPTLSQIATLGLTALFATGGHYCMTRALPLAPISVTQPVSFLNLLWAALIGTLLFGDMLDPWVIVGGLTIIGAICFTTWREQVAQSRA